MSLDRRAFILCVASSLVSVPAWSQQAIRRIGWISTEPQPDPFIEGFREGLRRLGYVEQQNLVIELRYAPGNFEKLQSAIAELKALNVAVIVSSGPATQAIKAHRDVHVLFAISGDPLELGIADSLARPGGNFTGSTFLSLEIAAKRVELFKEAVPHLRTLAVLSNTRHPGERSEWRATEQAARSLGIMTAYTPFDGPAELNAALARVNSARADGMIVFPDGVTFANRRPISEFAATNKLPSMFGWSEHCEPARHLCPPRDLRRPAAARRAPGRPAHRAADAFRAGVESRHRQAPGHDAAPVPLDEGRPHHRVKGARGVPDGCRRSASCRCGP
jgi:putative ABC transport system substrate-binding protein